MSGAGRLDAAQLDLLVAIDDTGSLSRAGQRLGTDQPRVSRGLRRVEEHLGVAVFERAARGTRPTPEGREVLRHARTALAALHRLDARADLPLPRQLRLLTHLVDGRGLATALRGDRPDLEIRQAPADPDGAVAALEQGTADVLVAARLPGAAWPRPPGVAETVVAEVPVMVLLGPRHPLARLPVLDPGDLEGARWVVLGDRSGAALLAEWAALGVRAAVRHRADGPDEAFPLLRGGRAVLWAPPTSIHRPGIVARPYRGASSAAVVVQHVPGGPVGELVPAVLAAVGELVRVRLERAAEGVDS